MAHYVKISNNLVTQVIVAEPEFFDTFVDSSPGEWIKTSYNTRGGKHYDQDSNEDSGTPLRKNYPGIGDTYDSTRDAFYKAQPYASWVFSEATCQWSAPVAYPDDDKNYEWNESETNWKEIK